jgi:enamine deaminase RidA (YjgF/YER057c/UK114 family)
MMRLSRTVAGKGYMPSIRATRNCSQPARPFRRCVAAPSSIDPLYVSQPTDQRRRSTRRKSNMATAQTIPLLTRVNPAALPDASAFGHSQITIVEPGRLAFISGQVAWQPGGGPVPDTIEGQAMLVLRNATTALEAVGATADDLVMMRVYVVDLTPERLQAVMPLLLAMLDGARPSLTGIGVSALAGADLQLEIEMVARVPS